MSRYKLRNLLLFTLLIVLPSCKRQGVTLDEAPEIQADLRVEPSPPSMGKAILELYLEDEHRKPVEGADLEVKGDMTHAGMQPVLGSFEEFAGGFYHAAFEWTMGGDWILTITGVLPDGRELVRTFELTVGSGMN